MLDFFRQPEFWGTLAAVLLALTLSGYWWTSVSQRRLATAALTAALVGCVYLGTEHGILAAAVAAVTGLVVAALAMEFGKDRAPSHAVVVDSGIDSANQPDSGQDVRLAS